MRLRRGGFRGFYVFLGCIALGVMAIAGVGSFAQSLADGIAREGRVILGGDVAFALIQREADAGERAFLAERWATVLPHDPYYNPNLSCYEGLFQLGEDTRTRRPWRRP